MIVKKENFSSINGVKSFLLEIDKNTYEKISHLESDGLFKYPEDLNSSERTGGLNPKQSIIISFENLSDFIKKTREFINKSDFNTLDDILQKYEKEILRLGENIKRATVFKDFISSNKLDALNKSDVCILYDKLENDFALTNDFILNIISKLKFTIDKYINEDRMPWPQQIISTLFNIIIENSCNFSDPGAGKTQVSIMTFLYFKEKELSEDEERPLKLLVVSPKSAFKAWKDDIKAILKPIYYPQNNQLFVFTSDSNSTHQKTDEIEIADPSVILTNFAQLGRLLKRPQVIKGYNLFVVLDEAHRVKLLKNEDKKQRKTQRNLFDKINIEHSYRTILTGTPAPNGPESIRSIIQAAWPSGLPNFKAEDFIRITSNISDKTNYNEVSGYNKIAKKEIAILNNKIGPLFTKIRKDKMKIPPALIDSMDSISPTQSQIKNEQLLLNLTKPEFLYENNIDAEPLVPLYTIIRMRQNSSHPNILNFSSPSIQDDLSIEKDISDNDIETNYTEDTLKKLIKSFKTEKSKKDLEIFEKYLSENWNFDIDEIPRINKLLEIVKLALSKDKKIIIWSYFTKTINLIQKVLCKEQIPSVIMYGMTPINEREQIIDNFNDKNYMREMVLIANPMAVGESISLHKGVTEAVFYEKDFNTGLFMQAKDRIHRLGVEDIVKITELSIGELKIDQQINQNIKRKLEFQTKVLSESNNDLESILIEPPNEINNKTILNNILKIENENFAFEEELGIDFIEDIYNDK